MRHTSQTQGHAVQGVGARGIVLVFVSALAFSTAGIFTKSVTANAWDVIFWRGISAVVFTYAFVLLRSGLQHELRRFGAPAALATVLMASGTAAFIPAFKLTSVANVSLIWATAPFFSAGLAWVFIKELPSARVMVCSGLALVGVMITVQGSFAAGRISGDLLALWMTLMMAGTMVVYRARPDTPTKLPSALSALVLLPIALLMSDPTQVVGAEIGVLIVFGLVFAAASILLAEGARLIPSAQAALISVLETPLALVWAMIILSEWPSVATTLGGVIIMVAVLSAQRQPRAAALPNLSARMRRDIGYREPYDGDRKGWHDQMAVEISRLR